MMRTIFAAAASFAGFFLFAIAAIFLVNLLPNSAIEQNLIRTSDAANYQPHPVYSTILLDQWTECELMTAGLYRDIDPSEQADTFDYRNGYSAAREAGRVSQAWRSTVLSPNIGNCELLHEGGGGKFYFRYWMGGQIFTRPLLYLSGVGANRVLVGALFLASLGAFLVFMARRAGLRLALGTAALIAAAPLFSQFVLLPHAAGWIIGFGFSALIMKWGHITHHGAVLMGLWSGMLLAFFDILNNPVVVPMALTLGYFVACHARAQAPSVLTLALLNMAWLAGYAGFWMSKWALAAVELGPDAVIANVLGKIGERANVTALADITWRDSLYRNGFFMAAPLVVFLMLAVRELAASRPNNPDSSPAVPATGPARWHKRPIVLWPLVFGTVPLVWILVLSNHSAIHYFFVSPILIWCFVLWHFAIFAACNSRHASHGAEPALAQAAHSS